MVAKPKPRLRCTFIKEICGRMRTFSSGELHSIGQQECPPSLLHPYSLHPKGSPQTRLLFEVCKALGLVATAVPVGFLTTGIWSHTITTWSFRSPTRHCAQYPPSIGSATPVT